MEKTSIFYYTNNVLSQKLLEYTLLSAIQHCKNNQCELILTSHYPLTESYTIASLGNHTPLSNSLNSYTVMDVSIPNSELEGVNIKSYVVGQLPYSYESILKQIIFSLEQCSGDNIILMEHDCLYPDNYIPTLTYSHD